MLLFIAMFGVSVHLHDVLVMHRHEVIQEALPRLQQKSQHQRIAFLVGEALEVCGTMEIMSYSRTEVRARGCAALTDSVRPAETRSRATAPAAHAVAARWRSLYGPALREPGMAADQAGGPGSTQCVVTDSSAEKFWGKRIGW